MPDGKSIPAQQRGNPRLLYQVATPSGVITITIIVTTEK